MYKNINNLTFESPSLVGLRALPRQRRHSTIVNRNQTIIANGQRQDQQQPEVNVVNQTLITSLAVVGIIAALPPSAQASPWKPRRHLKRMAVEQAPIPPQPKTEQKAATTETQSKAAIGTQSTTFQDIQRSAQQAYRSIAKTVLGNNTQKPSYSVSISGRPDPKTYYNYRSGQPEASPLGWIAAAIAATGVLYLIIGKHLNFPSWFKTTHKGQTGRWIRDRSLGGRMVFVPDGSSTTKEPRPLWEDNDDVLDSMPSEFSLPKNIARTAASGGVLPLDDLKTSTSSTATRTSTTPEWWDPPSSAPVYCPASRKESIQKQVKAVLREMEDDKLLRGLDYPVSGLVTLRTLCQEGGVQVKASAENRRDAIYRAAVKAAVEASADPTGNGQVGGYTPSRFVTGLAHDLQVPDSRAVTLVHAEVAATCRSAIIASEAGDRAGDQTDVVTNLIRLVGLLSSLPLPSGSPEAEMVARSVRDVTSLDFRRSAFLLAGSANVQVAPLIAELLGFDPNAVMPQLVMQMEAARKAAASQQQQQ